MERRIYLLWETVGTGVFARTYLAGMYSTLENANKARDYARSELPENQYWVAGPAKIDNIPWLSYDFS